MGNPKIMNWGVEDFAAAATLLGVAGIALAAILKTVGSRVARLLLSGTVVFAVLAIWAHLAVGII